MKKQTLLSLFSLTFLLGNLSADTLTINQKRITIPSPSGYMRVTEGMKAAKTLADQIPDNPTKKTFSYYIHERHKADELIESVPQIDRTFMLYINPKFSRFEIGENEFSQLIGMYKKDIKSSIEIVKAKTEKYMEAMSQGVSREFDTDLAIRVADVVPFEPHRETSNIFAFSTKVKHSVESNDTHTINGQSSTTLILNTKGVVLYLCCYAPMNELEWTRKAAMAWADDILVAAKQN